MTEERTDAWGPREGKDSMYKAKFHCGTQVSGNSGKSVSCLPSTPVNSEQQSLSQDPRSHISTLQTPQNSLEKFSGGKKTMIIKLLVAC